MRFIISTCGTVSAYVILVWFFGVRMWWKFRSWGRKGVAGWLSTGNADVLSYCSAFLLVCSVTGVLLCQMLPPCGLISSNNGEVCGQWDKLWWGNVYINHSETSIVLGNLLGLMPSHMSTNTGVDPCRCKLCFFLFHANPCSAELEQNTPHGRIKFHQDGVPNFHNRSAQILTSSSCTVHGSSWNTRNVMVGVPTDPCKLVSTTWMCFALSDACVSIFP